MITVKIADLLNSTEILRKLSQQDFKAKVAWQIARILKAAETELQGFNDARMSLIKKYGESDENGELITDENGNCKISPEQISNFNIELNDLINTEIEINGNKIDVAHLEDCDFTPSDMALLEPFIEE